MIPYYTILILLIILAIYFKKIGPNGLVILYLIWIILTLFAGLRYENADWENYEYMFNEVYRNHDNASKDIGFNFILKLLTLLSNSSIAMFIAIAGISSALNIKSFLKYTPYVFVALLLYFVHNFVLKEMIQIRVGLASAICLYSFQFINSNKYKQSIILWLIAISIHVTTVVFGLVIIGHILNPSKKILLYIVIASFIIGMSFPLGSIIKENIGLDDRLDSYIAYGDAGYATKTGIFNNLNTLKTIVVFCFLYTIYNRIVISNQYFKILFISYSFGLCWMMCFNDFSIIGARMSNILLCVEPILLTLPLGILRKQKYYLYKFSIILLAIIIFYTNVTPDKITPYNFYLSKFL